MSAKARLWRLATLAYRWLVASSPAPRMSFERQEPNLGAGRAAPSPAPQADEDFDDEIDEDDDDAPVARAPRKRPAPRAPQRKSSDKFELPSVNVLTAPRASDRQPLSKTELDTNSRALEGVLGDFGVRGKSSRPIPVLS